MTKHSRPNEAARLNIVLSKDVAAALEEIADATDSTKTAVIRQAIALMKLAHEEKKKGRHFGFSSRSDQLETEIVGNF